MGWEVLIPIIAKYGLEFAQYLWTLAASGKVPTVEDWAKLTVLANQTSDSQMKDALARAGIPLDDPRAAIFLALVK